MGWGEGCRKEGELSGIWEFFLCFFSVFLKCNYYYVFKDLIVGIENFFGEVFNLYLSLSVFGYVRDFGEIVISGL